MNVWACLTIVFGVLAMMLFFEVLVQKDNVKEKEQIIKNKEEVIKRCTKEIQDKTIIYDGSLHRMQEYTKERYDLLTKIKELEENQNSVREFKVVTACKQPVTLHYTIDMPYDISDCPNIQREVTQQAIEQLAHDIIGNDLYTHRKTTNFTSGVVRHEYRVDMFKED